MPPLTDAQLRSLKPVERTQRLFDGGGLYLELTPAGGRYWRQKYRHEGQERRLSHGVYPAVTLAQARAKREDARALLRRGVDPGAAKRANRRAVGDDFETVAREWLKKQSLADATRDKTLWMLESFVFPAIGARAIGKITAPDLLDDVLQPLDARGIAETAHRTRQVISRVFRYAVVTRRADTDPTYALRGALAPVKPVSHAALTEPDAVGGLLRAIDGYQGAAPTVAALRLTPLLFVRPLELRSMEWAELDLRGALWRIPAGKMKMRREHLVPLSKQALAILKSIQPVTGEGRYCFPSLRTFDRPLSENTINGALRRLGYATEEMTAHGFRSTASTLLHELGFDTRVIEVQLAHADPDQTRGIYNRAKYLPQRKKLMQAWADYLDKLRRPSARK